MSNDDMIRKYRRVKLIQLILLIVFMLSYLIVLLVHSPMTRRIYNNATLLHLCAVGWFMLVAGLLGLIYDIWKLRSFAKISDTLNKLAYVDSLTSMPNRNSLDELLKKMNTPESVSHAGCFMASIRNLKEINEEHGRAAGDTLMKDFCGIFEKVAAKYGTFGRNGGNNFILLLSNCDPDSLSLFSAELTKEIEMYNAAHEEMPIDLCHAWTANSPSAAQDVSALLAVTYQKLQY